tara:strand:+ start:13846 stop:15270 length:1425 start_codon:yes stop_codon:yes gene_type:complete
MSLPVIPDDDTLANTGATVKSITTSCTENCDATCARADTTCVASGDRRRRLSTFTVVFNIVAGNLAEIATLISTDATLSVTSTTVEATVDAEDLATVINEFKEEYTVTIESVQIDDAGANAAFVEEASNIVAQAFVDSGVAAETVSVVTESTGAAVTLCDPATERKHDGTCKDCTALQAAALAACPGSLLFSYPAGCTPATCPATTSPTKAPTPPTNSPTNNPTEYGWPHYYVYGDGSQCPTDHDILDQFDCYNAFVELYGHLAITEHLSFKGHFNVENAPRGCAYQHDTTDNSHNYLINYHQSPSGSSGDYAGYVALCRNYRYMIGDDNIRTSAESFSHLFDPSSEWVDYESNSCGPQGATFTSTVECPQGVAADDITLEVDKKILLQVPGPTQHVVPGVDDIKLSISGCDYYAWTVYHCVLGQNVTHHVVSEVVDKATHATCESACKAEFGADTHGFTADSFGPCGLDSPPY